MPDPKDLFNDPFFANAHPEMAKMWFNIVYDAVNNLRIVDGKVKYHDNDTTKAVSHSLATLATFLTCWEKFLAIKKNESMTPSTKDS